MLNLLVNTYRALLGLSLLRRHGVPYVLMDLDLSLRTMIDYGLSRECSLAASE
jgi:hypothetical protein